MLQKRMKSYIDKEKSGFPRVLENLENLENE